MRDEQPHALLAIALRGVLDRAERDQLRRAVAVEVRDRRRGVREVRLLLHVLVVGVALLREVVVDHPADAGELRAVPEDRVRIERAPVAGVQRHVCVVLRREDVGLVIAVDVADRDVLIVAAGDVAGVVAARGAGGVRREAGEHRAIALDRDHDVALVVRVQRRRRHRDQLERAVAVDVARRERAQLVAPHHGEAGQGLPRCIERRDLAARCDRDLEARLRGHEIGDHRRRPDPSGHRGAPCDRAATAGHRVPHDQQIVPRCHDLHGAIAIEIRDRRRGEPRLLIAIVQRVRERGSGDRRRAVGGRRASGRR
jgi:hypothetical protein